MIKNERIRDEKYILPESSMIRINNYDFEIMRDEPQEGGSVVCYVATRVSTGEKGYLKEFIPVSYLKKREVKRDNITNTLIIGLDNEFKNMKNEYMNSFLQARRHRNKSDNLLNNFMPHFEMLNDENGTVYLWIPEPVIAKRYNEYLNDVVQNPIDLCEQKLLNILNVCVTVAKFVREIHKNNLLVLDIKPENLSVEYDSKGENRYEINTKKISFYDVNTLQIKKDRLDNPTGTNGYVAPEVTCGYGYDTSDIYSIGAMLYYSIIVKEDELEDGYKNVEYNGRKYNNISKDINESILIKYSVINSGESVKSKLSLILQNCLNINRYNRYQSCDELINALDEVIALLTPRAIIDRLGYKKSISIIDMNSKLRTLNYDPPIQLALWHRPIYKYFCNDKGSKERVNILILGNNDIVYRIIDNILQCKMRGIAFTIYVLTPSAEYSEGKYTGFRPAAKSFLNINNSNTCADDSIEFIDLNLKNYSNEYFIKDIESVLESRKIVYDYSFVSFEQDYINNYIAEELHKRKWICGASNYICRDSENMMEHSESVYPIFVNSNSSKLCDDSDYRLLERLAFNVHVIWKEGVGDYQEEYNRFIKDTYNYTASLKFALSIKYKLFSIGVDYDDCNLKQKLTSILSSASKNEIYEMAELEHIRWVYYYMSEGWTAPIKADGTINYHKCILNNIPCIENNYKYVAKNELEKKHACMVVSTAACNLEEFDSCDWAGINDSSNILNDLDDLDKVSVLLYREAVKYLKGEGIEHPDEFIERIDYKKYDVKLIEQLSDIIFSKHISGNYDYVPNPSDTSSIDISCFDDNDIQIISSELKEYYNSILQEYGFKYGSELSLEKKTTSDFVPYDRMNDQEKEQYNKHINKILKIILSRMGKK